MKYIIAILLMFTATLAHADPVYSATLGAVQLLDDRTETGAMLDVRRTNNHVWVGAHVLGQGTFRDKMTRKAQEYNGDYVLCKSDRCTFDDKKITTKKDRDFIIYGIGAGLDVPIAKERVILTGGIGWSWMDAEHVGTDNGPSVRAGLRVPVSDSLSVSAEYMRFMNDTLSVNAATVGVQLKF